MTADGGAPIPPLPAGGGEGGYRRDLFDLIVCLNRRVLRVAACASLMTDACPPFRLDQGGDELAPRPVA
ncbi:MULTISPECIES: hypothetical protein [Streptomyces]|uniref:Uncharacterized protein n=2 Tax=Streptomyces TaxID=1883 RepID=A0ABU4KG49_9ACTN|nr:hypothetical protein [Streptomyces roseolus]MDX2296312.1 hypothetical protein [Streptomyces roseolus]